jgi:polyisoprenoid-binding protein YceI
MKIVLAFFLALGFSVAGHAQKFAVEKSAVSFYSKAAIEDIKAHTSKSTSLINVSTGDIAFVIPIEDFEFVKSLMKEHFNEKYMESEKYPKATFVGKLSGFDPAASGVQKATATGEMTIHGVTQRVAIPGTMTVAKGKIELASKFIIKLADYKVSIPTLLFRNIAEQVEVTVEFTYSPQ